MKIAIYARVSSKEQSEKEQIPAIKRGFNITEDCLIYQEEISAWNLDKENKREVFSRLKQDIMDHKISQLYIWDIDRLYRNRRKTREFFEFCKYNNVDIYSLNQKWINDFQHLKKQFPDNFKFLIDNIYSLLLDVFAQTAEDESNKKSERVKLKITKDSETGRTISVAGKVWGRKALPQSAVETVLSLSAQGRSIRRIAKEAYYFDKSNNKKYLSVGSVHKILSQKSTANGS